MAKEVTGKTSELKEFWSYMIRREQIRRRKEAGEPWPWSEDKIFQEYKFCNVYRQDDKNTRLLNSLIGLNNDKREALVDIVAFRMINRYDTFTDVLLPSHYEALDHWRARLQAREDRGDPIMTSAHLTTGRAGMFKWESVVETCKQVLYSVKDWDPRTDDFLYSDRLQDWQDWIMNQKWFGVGKFIAYEIVCDLRFRPEFGKATDAMTWANVGPGAYRGLLRLGLDPSVAEMLRLLDLAHSEESMVSGVILQSKWPFEFREIEHNLCEFDKYERTRTGIGRPKEKYWREVK